jgi:hypothetical protein
MKRALCDRPSRDDGASLTASAAQERAMSTQRACEERQTALRALRQAREAGATTAGTAQDANTNPDEKAKEASKP